MNQATLDEPNITKDDGSLIRTNTTLETKKPGGGYGFFYALAVAIVGAIVAFNVIRPITVLPRITPSPGYAFFDQNGHIITSEDHRGKLTLYSFSYTDCDESCPQTIEQIDALRQQLSDIPADLPLTFVTISLNPESDTPERLSNLNGYLPSIDFDNGLLWSFLSGDPHRTRLVVGGGFGVFYSEPNSEEGIPITFEPRYVLVDHLGIMRAEYRTATPDPALITRDINLIVNEAAKSDGIARLGYEAAHLFLCYPR